MLHKWMILLDELSFIHSSKKNLYPSAYRIPTGSKVDKVPLTEADVLAETNNAYVLKQDICR